MCSFFDFDVVFSRFISLEKRRFFYGGKMKERNILQYAGELLDSRVELAHVTQYYRVKPASMDSDKLECTSRICRSGEEEPLVVIKYERDHRAEEYFDVFCNACAPAMFRLILEKTK